MLLPHWEAYANTQCASSFNLKLDFPFRYIDFLAAFKYVVCVFFQFCSLLLLFFLYFSWTISKQLTLSVCHFYLDSVVGAEKCRISKWKRSRLDALYVYVIYYQHIKQAEQFIKMIVLHKFNSASPDLLHFSL